MFSFLSFFFVCEYKTHQKEQKKHLELLHALLHHCRLSGAIGVLHLQSVLSFNYPASQ